MKYPRFTLILSDKNGKEVHTYYTKRMKSIPHRLNLKFKRGFHIYIRVRYGKDPEGGYFENEGTFFIKKDFFSAWRAFIDPDIIKDFRNVA